MILLDKIQLRQTNRDKKPLLTFNVIAGENDHPVFYGIGFSVMDGVLRPPSFRIGANYYGSAYLTVELARELYDLVNALADDFPECFPLQPEVIAIDAVKLSTANWLRLFPTASARRESL